MNMPRWLAVAALGAALIAVPSWGQRGGGGHGGGFGGHAGFAGHAGFSSRPAMGFRGPSMAGRGFGAPRGNFGFHNRPFPHNGFPHNGFCRGCFHRRFSSWYPWGYGWGWPWYGDYDDADNYQSQPPSDSYNEPDYQSQAEIDRLHDEVSRLRDQVESRNVPRPPEPKQAAPEPTQLVFADKHTEQIENYAIVRQTLWVFDGSRTRKIPLASLDVPATQKANDERGVDFEIPN